MWLEGQYAQLYLRHSIYFQIGFVGVALKTVGLFFQFFVFMSELSAVENSLGGEVILVSGNKSEVWLPGLCDP